MKPKKVKNLGKPKYPKTKAVEHVPERPPPLSPQKFKKSKEDAYLMKFIDIFREHHINLPFLDVL